MGGPPRALRNFYRKVWSLGAAGTVIPSTSQQNNEQRRFELKSIRPYGSPEIQVDLSNPQPLPRGATSGGGCCPAGRLPLFRRLKKLRARGVSVMSWLWGRVSRSWLPAGRSCAMRSKKMETARSGPSAPPTSASFSVLPFGLVFLALVLLATGQGLAASQRRHVGLERGRRVGPNQCHRAPARRHARALLSWSPPPYAKTEPVQGCPFSAWRSSAIGCRPAWRWRSALHGGCADHVLAAPQRGGGLPLASSTPWHRLGRHVSPLLPSAFAAAFRALKRPQFCAGCHHHAGLRSDHPDGAALRLI
jgi:hypothetical protein